MKYKVLLCILMSVFIHACDDVFEEDIDKKKIQLNTPIDKLTTTNATVYFSWEDIEDADNFQIQVVRGRFDSIASFVLDSSINRLNFTYTFNPGSYQWRVRGMNSVSATDFGVRSFQIDTTSDLTLTRVILQAPLGGISAKTQQTFRWNEVFGADSYIFELREDSWISGTTVFKDTLSEESVVLNSLGSKTYAWGVKAINETSETDYSNNSFEVDVTPPATPSLTSPANQTSTSLVGPSIDFQWRRGQDDNWSHDSIYIYRNSTNTLIEQQRVETESFTDSLTSGIYLWRVKSIDTVNNRSNFSPTWTFSVL